MTAKAHVMIYGLGIVNKPTTEITIKEEGKEPQTFVVDEVFLEDDTGLIKELWSAL